MVTKFSGLNINRKSNPLLNAPKKKRRVTTLSDANPKPRFSPTLSVKLDFSAFSDPDHTNNLNSD